MRTNIEIDDRLLAEAMRAAGTSTKKATVEAGLVELIRRHRIRKVLRRRRLWKLLRAGPGGASTMAYA